MTNDGNTVIEKVRSALGAIIIITVLSLTIAETFSPTYELDAEQFRLLIMLGGLMLGVDVVGKGVISKVTDNINVTLEYGDDE